MVAPVLIALLVGSALAAVRRHRRSRLPARALIVSPRDSTVTAHDGAVTSVQTAELLMPRARCERLWSPASLENLGRTYWRFLSRVTLGLIRVIYGENERRVVFLFKPFTLLRFGGPEYEIEADHGSVRWQIRDGLLVARHGHGCGYLALDVRREDLDDSDQAKLRIEVEVANFYPSIASGFSMPVYMATQAFVHVLVTHAFLRSLATLELAKSKVGRLAWPEAPEVPSEAGEAPKAPVQP
jgi:hypothetical protein